jgi:hypothetical protein
MSTSTSVTDRAAPAEVEVPRLLGGEPVRVLGYPLVMVLAEKIVTMVERGQANARSTLLRRGLPSVSSPATAASR